MSVYWTIFLLRPPLRSHWLKHPSPWPPCLSQQWPRDPSQPRGNQFLVLVVGNLRSKNSCFCCAAAVAGGILSPACWRVKKIQRKDQSRDGERLSPPPHHPPTCGILVPWPGIEAVPSAGEAQSPNHWTTKEFTRLSLDDIMWTCRSSYAWSLISPWKFLIMWTSLSCVSVNCRVKSLFLLFFLNLPLFWAAHDSIFFFTSLLEYKCFTMLCYFLLYNKVNQLYVYIYPHYPHIPSLPPFLSHPSRLSQSIELISLCYAAASH